ncbi:cyclic AMP-dependent transcription factor ATF-7-like isoform X2 [Apostichopus japonicus]|uniref:cyclic AMP-dependent transcription factor ATF-7-like isoform X2 n=1 Tax=Stichopus japonicus TaxID=307972 RepID=UPI003AB80D84
MNNEDKPFPCTIGSCKQRFANADHLHVHCLKHEMSLKSLDTPVINDTTPTPTRFLKYENVSEDTLFTDLVPSTNPFDMEFKQATEQRRMSQDVSSSGNCLLETPESKPPDSDSGLDSEPSLETVTEQSVPTNELPEEITSTTGDPPASVVPQESITLPEVIKEVSQLVKVTDVASVPAAPKYEPALPPSVQSQVLSQLQQQPQIQQQSVIQGETKLQSQQVPVAKPQSTITAQTVAPVQAQANSLQSIVNSLPSTITAPLLIKLPDGQQIRVVPSIVANPSAPVPVAISANQNSSKMPSKSTIEQLDASTGGKRAIKERLKEAVLSNQSHGNMNVMARAVEVRMREQQHEQSQVIKQETTNVTVVAPNSMEETIEAAQIGGTKRRSSDDDDPEMKRQKFLERNRAAAMRCREKKKQWVVNLESKAENLTVTNVKLNNEVLKLKNEVAQLKQLLLAHKDCPVTQMQQRQSQNWQVFHAISESEEEKNTQQQSNTTTVTTSMQEVTSNGDEVTITSTDIPTVLISQT